jgi:3-methyladenine DNA glycosylase Tag
METLDRIYKRACKRHGSEAAVAEHLSKPKSKASLKKISDDRWLAAMTKSVFQAGFVWKVIEAKWSGFEEAFDGFDPHKVAFYSDEDLGRLVSDTRIVRNGAKIKATVENAQFVTEIIREHGSAGKFFAASKPEDFIGLLDVLKRRGSRLSGASAQYFLRFSGVDSWILSPSVVAALVNAGVVEKAPTSKRALIAVQAAFNDWRQESGRSLTEISRILAMSADPL